MGKNKSGKRNRVSGVGRTWLNFEMCDQKMCTCHLVKDFMVDQLWEDAPSQAVGVSADGTDALGESFLMHSRHSLEATVARAEGMREEEHMQIFSAWSPPKGIFLWLWMRWRALKRFWADIMALTQWSRIFKRLLWLLGWIQNEEGQTWMHARGKAEGPSMSPRVESNRTVELLLPEEERFGRDFIPNVLRSKFWHY